jgi:hypothetical protein
MSFGGPKGYGSDPSKGVQPQEYSSPNASQEGNAAGFDPSQGKAKKSIRQSVRNKAAKALAPILPSGAIAALKPPDTKILKKKSQDNITTGNSQLDRSVETFQQKRAKGNQVQTDTWKFDPYS